MSSVQHNIEKFLKSFIFSILWTLFGLLAYEAVAKYLYQPIATEITYTNGENGKIIFPKFTICPYNRATDILAPCGNGSTFYQDALKSCLQTENFDLNNFLQEMNYDRTDLFDDLYHLYQPRTSENDQNSIWSPAIHAKFGLCYTIGQVSH